tara:strand:- start:9936 stop:11030 length:1095 start_codon:yes stop_codon:yes gene_type:complete
MRGVVEVWRGDKLILEEPNMLVDGAGELLADIMTVSPSLSGIEDHATSSILDASNYRINAISFGTGKDAFRANAHALGEDSLQQLTGSRRDNHLDGLLGMLAVNSLPNNPGVGFPAVIGLPDSPNPAMAVLEEDTSVSSKLPDSAGKEYSVSAITPGNGQLTNFIPSAIYSSVYDSTVFDSTTSASVAASLMGAFPDGSSAPYSLAINRIAYRPTGGAEKFAVIDGGFFNEVSSMDLSGFVNMVMSSVPNAGLQFSGGASGLCLSAPAEETNEGFPFAEYTVSLASGDCNFAHAYGGITHLGLWTIDMERSLLNGNTPPFAFSVLNNPRKYKLFCRKGLSKDLTHITDVDKYEDLTIKWRIHFR